MDGNDSSDLPAAQPDAAPPARVSDSRRLSAQEVDDVLRRASRTADGQRLFPGEGTTVTDLVEAAREVGLDADAVRRAVAIQPAPSRGLLVPLTGAPDHLAVRAELSGPLPEIRAALAAAAARASGRDGRVLVDEPSRFVWRESHGIGRTTVEWSERDGAVLTVTSDRAGHYFAHWFSGLLGWAALSSLLSIGVGPVAATLLFVVTPFVLARPFWIRSDRRARRELDEIAMAVLEAAETPTP